MIKLGFAFAVLLGACTSSPIDVHGSIDNVDGPRTFDALGGLFDIGTHYDPFSSNGVMFTELRFTNDADPCAWWASGSASTAVHYPLLEVQAAIFTGSPMQTTNGIVDLSAHTPGAFPLSPAASTDAQANAAWVVEGTSSGYNGNFTGGTIHLTTVSEQRLEGTIELAATDNQAITGSFSVAHCAAADWAH